VPPHAFLAGHPAGLLAASGAAGPSPLWYTTRATGVVSLLLLTATVALGVAGVARLSSPRWPRVVTAGLHRNVSLLAVAFIVVHVLTTVLDSFTSISLVSAVIPFTSSYRPLWLSLGAIAFDLILAVVLTSLLRTRISFRAWRAVHWLAYASWPIALWHGLGTGTDARLPWLLALDAACVAGVAGALLWRLSQAEPGSTRFAAVLATLGLVLATIVFAAAGPLQPHWAERAGTPVALLGSASTVAPSHASGGWVAFTGHVTVTKPGAGQEVITVTARTTGANAQDVHIVLRGAPDGTAISMTSGSVQVTPAVGGSALAGPVTKLSGAQLDATLRGASGAEQAQLLLAIHGSQASGQLMLRPGES
jgi:methionine sulfoxide reductase heme-binding subunit